MRLSTSLLVLGFSQSVPSVYGWGELGHRTVAYLAQYYMNEATLDYVNTILGDEEIGKAAIYPDVHRNEMRWSAPWHYIDAEDEPPAACGIIYASSCPDVGCVVRAIVNETSIINNASWTEEDRRMALRFIIHFIGDMHQPLHTEATEKGGNGIAVIFDKRKTNLHAAWDTSIPNKLAVTPGNNLQLAAKAWAAHLHLKDVSGSDGATFDARAECSGLDDTEQCALDWAGEANLWVCKYVLKDGPEALRHKEIGGKYYEGAKPIVEEMVTHAGKRLGAFLTLLAEQNQELQTWKTGAADLITQEL